MKNGYTYYYKIIATIDTGTAIDTIEHTFTGFSTSDKWQAKQRAKLALNRYTNNKYLINSELIECGFIEE